MRKSVESIEAELEAATGERRGALLEELSRHTLRTQPEQAVRAAHEALAIARDIQQPVREALALDALGCALIEHGEYERALQCLLESLRILEDRGSRRQRASVLGNVGLVHLVWRDFDRALEFHQRSLALVMEDGDESLEAGLRNGIGIIQVQRGEEGEAMREFERALELGRATGKRVAQMTALNNLGNILRNKQDYDLALEHYQASLEFKREFGDRKGIAGTLVNLADVHTHLRAFEEAREEVVEGLAIAKELNAREFMLRGYEVLASLNEQVGDLAGALEALRHFIRLREELFDQEQGERIAEMQARYDTERAAHEAESSHRKSQELTGQLLQAQKMGVLGRLAGGIAHDFNNFLTAIGGYADLSLMTLDENHPLRHNLVEIRRGAERAGALTRQLLAFSRKQVMQPRVLDLSRTVAGLVRMLGRLLGEDIHLTTHLEAELHPVYADAGQIEQVIVNLAVNARDAMPVGGSLEIATTNIDPGDLPQEARDLGVDGAFVQLSVTDTGCGMSAEVIEQIFEPFFTTKSREEGTGLGLATVHGIVSQSGGVITVDSDVSQGTTFRIYLPRTDRGTIDLGESTRALPAARGEETILLVEDEAPVRDLAREILELHGYRVLDAASAEAALELVGSHAGSIELLLTDVVLPGARGGELADRVRSTLPNIRILYMSGYSHDLLSKDGALASDTELIEKPFSASGLAQRVRAVLDAE